MNTLLERFPLRVNVRLLSRPRSSLPFDQGEWTLEAEGHNLVTTVGKAHVANMLADVSGYDTGLTYCEIGTGTNTPAITDTALQTPTKRNIITTRDPSDNRVPYRTFYPAADCSVFIKEIGLFGHSTATATIGTGILFNHAAMSFDNSAGTKDLTLLIQVTFG